MCEKIILAGLSISMVLYWIYETEVVWEYLYLISKIVKNNKFDGMLLLSAWKHVRPRGEHKNYLNFLNATYNLFITRLLMCPICIVFYLSILTSIIIQNMIASFGIAFCGLFGYFVLKLLTNKVKIL